MILADIFLGAFVLFVLVGFGKSFLKDFKISGLLYIIFSLAVIGLNFVPKIDLGFMTFGLGTALFYMFIILHFFIRGKLTGGLTALSVAIILGGLAYTATRLSLISGNAFFGKPNFVYALVIGVLAAIITGNGKYSFIASAEGVMLLALAVQLPTAVYSMNYAFEWATLAAITAGVTQSVMARVFTGKPSKLSYYYEFGRLND